MSLITRTFFEASGLEIRKAADGKETLSGYAVKWDQLSKPIRGMFREKVASGAFTNSLKENNIRGLWNHNSDFVLGSTGAGTMRCQEDKSGLAFEIDLGNQSFARDAAITISRGDVVNMSFGFNVKKQSWNESDSQNVVRTLEEVDLQEISPCTFPAYPQSSVAIRSMADDFTEFAESRKIEAKKVQAEIANALTNKKRKLNLNERGLI
jgi:HK97 family phage prohead protease